MQTTPPIRIGYVPLVDAAPLIMAAELGLFTRHGVNIQLSREAGWATIRNKVIYQELEAAHAPAGTVIAASCGLGSIPALCLTGFIFNLHGNAVTLSETLWGEGSRSGSALQKEIARGKREYVFAVTSPYASHNFLMRSWLLQNNIQPDRDVRMVVVPPPQMPATLRAGHVDGFCAGEPWNSFSVMKKYGWIAATSSELAPGHPEKALLVRESFARERSEQHVAIIAALIEACRFCHLPENQERVAETLAQRKYLNAPIQAIRAGLSGTFDFGHGRTEQMPDFHVFSGPLANEPTQERGNWVFGQMKAHGLFPDAAQVSTKQMPTWFRSDIYEQALSLTNR